MYWNTYRLSYSGHVIFKVAIKKDNEAYPHINGSMKKLATRAICAGHLASYYYYWNYLGALRNHVRTQFRRPGGPHAHTHVHTHSRRRSVPSGENPREAPETRDRSRARAGGTPPSVPTTEPQARSQAALLKLLTTYKHLFFCRACDSSKQSAVV